MQYQVCYKPRAVRDLEGLPNDLTRRIIAKIDMLQNNLAGDVKRLKQFEPKYRLRVGDYRVLFNIEAQTITIYRIRHRREVYGP